MQVGFIGIGLMGLPMAQRLVEAKIDLVLQPHSTEARTAPEGRGEDCPPTYRGNYR